MMKNLKLLLNIGRRHQCPRHWTAAQGQDTLEDTDCPTKVEVKLQSCELDMDESIGKILSHFRLSEEEKL